MKITIFILLKSFILLNLSYAGEVEPDAKSQPKVLYVTHEPGKYHDYTGQRKVFEEIAAKQNWKTTVLSSSYEGLTKRFSDDADFAKGYDVVIYNICMADTTDTMAAYNVIKQTNEHGVNALLVHGALHSFRPTYSPRAKTLKMVDPKDHVRKGVGKAVVSPKLVNQWNNKNPDKDFPVWGDFCGCASIKHLKHAPILVNKVAEHSAAKGVPSEYTTGMSELYLIYYKVGDVSVILNGSVNAKDLSPVLWETTSNQAKVMAFSLGHYVDEWKTPEFQAVLVDSVNYLAGDEEEAE